MKYSITILFLLVSVQLSAQQYRLAYDAETLPELYHTTIISVQELKGSDYVIMPNRKYQLSTNDGSLSGNQFTYTPTQLYKNNGKMHFTLAIEGKSLPLTLELPLLQNIRYNLYTDSIKPVLNFYVNVEGNFSSGRTLPLDTSFVTISASESKMTGMEWVVPVQIDFEKVRFTTICKYKPSITESITVYLKTLKDPKDEPDTKR